MAQTTPSQARLLSLDAFRGATIALMVLVNDPGDGQHVYAPLQHAEWHGWTITDVVFPSFLWIVGVALTLSIAKRLASGATRAQLLRQAARRAALIFALGLLVYAYPEFHLSTQRFLGVLQRIAICYFIAAAIYLWSGWRGQIVWIVSLLGVYWALMMLVPAPGYEAGRLDVEGNLAHYIDRVVLGVHNYRWTKTWDPEGILSTLPAIATVLFGIMAGHVIALRRELAERTAWLFAIGNSLIAIGLICNVWLPINKKLWTSSFSIFMAGLDFVLLALFIWLIDHLGQQRYVKPLFVVGVNPIAVYMMSELLDETLNAIHWTSGDGAVTLHSWLYGTFFAPLASPINASLLWAVGYTLLMVGFAYLLHWRKWIIKV